MRILFIGHYFPPEVNAPANRTHEHAREWVRQGHQVTVITGVPNHPHGQLAPGYENRLIQEETMDGIRVIRTWMYLTANAGFFRRIANFVLFGLAAVLASLRVEKPDVVVSTTPQFFAGLAGAIAARIKGVPFVLEVRDLWPESIVQLGQLRNERIIALLETIESWLYRSADGIVVNTRSFIDHILRRGVDRDRIELVYNGIDQDLFYPRPKDPELLARHGLENRFVVAYIGTLGLAHGLETVLDTAEQMRDQSDVAFALIGDGADRARLEEEIRERKLENVSLLGLQPRDTIPAWIASVDVSLVMLRDLPVFETVIPSKTFEFLAEECPVIVAAKGEIRRMVDEAKAGFTIDPGNPAQLAEAIREIRAHPSDAAARARAGRNWVEQDFVRSELAKRMSRFLERFAGGSN